jgi:DNA-binding response OmpR family regulator
MRVLLVEDEPELAAALAAALVRRGCIVDQAGTLAEGEAAVMTARHEAVLLDWRLPDGEGVNLLDVIRSGPACGTPVIMLTARGDVDDRVVGLDRGADDYIVKPVAIEELMARLRAVRRRPANGAEPKVVTMGSLSLDLLHQEATVDGVALSLPRRERAVLTSLARRAGRVVLREALIERVFGFDDEIASNTLDAHVSRLRGRLNAANARVEIHAIRGVGYMLKALP